ncbi:MAG: porin [Pseudomonadota bacterium]
MMRFLTFLTGLLVAVATTAAPAMAAEKNADEPKIQVRFLIQPQMQLIQAKKQPGADALVPITPDNNGIGQEFFLRRTRVILAGQVNKWIHFFFETDNPNLGRNGNIGNTFTQDGYIDFRFFDELKVAMGMILMPFSRNNRQSAASLMGLDYHGDVFTAWGPTRIWRDYGIEARGVIAGNLDYRVGVFNGFRGPAATNDIPRFTGRVSYDFFGADPKFFYTGTYLGKAKHLSIGYGFDVQPEGSANAKGEKGLYYALTGDVFIDWPLGNDMAATLNTGFMFYSYGSKKAYIQTSTAMFGELGFMWKDLQPVFGFEWAQPLDGKAYKDNQILNFRVGVNYYITGHNATVKLEYANTLNTIGYAKAPGGPEASDYRRNVITLQTQLLF